MSEIDKATLKAFNKKRMMYFSPNVNEKIFNKFCYYLRVILLAFCILGKDADNQDKTLYIFQTVIYASILNFLCYSQILQSIVLKNNAFLFHGLLFNIYMIHFYMFEVIFEVPIGFFRWIMAVIFAVTLIETLYLIFSLTYSRNQTRSALTKTTTDNNLKCKCPIYILSNFRCIFGAKCFELLSHF